MGDFAAAFANALPEDARRVFAAMAPAARDALLAALARELAEIRRDRGLAVPADDLAAFVAARVPPGATDVAAALAALAKADLALACACLARDPAGVAAVERDLLSRIPLYIAHIRMGDAARDDLVQQMRERMVVGHAGVPPRLAAYQGKGSLEGFVRIAATRLALDLLEREGKHAATPRDLDVAAFGATPDPELEHVRQRYQGTFAAAFRAALAALEPADRNLLRWHFVEGLSVTAIAGLLGIDKSNASRRLAGVRRRVFDGTRARVMETLGVSATEMQSVLRVVRSQLDVSIRRLL